MGQVYFTHPNKALSPGLVVNVAPNQIGWSYGLNVATYPTYGGEVVQILSVYFDDMTISGNVSTYAEMEEIYKWFILYMQIASQGRDRPSYNQQPVQFSYPERGWNFDLWPKALPGFRYSRDLTVPSWTLVAAVKEPDAQVADLIKDYATADSFLSNEVKLFGKTTADFGKTGDLINNPWASPDGAAKLSGGTVKDYVTKLNKAGGDTFVAFVNDYSSQSLSDLPEFHDISSLPNPFDGKKTGGKTPKSKTKSKTKTKK